MITLDHHEELIMPERDDDMLVLPPVLSNIVFVNGINFHQGMQQGHHAGRHAWGNRKEDSIAERRHQSSS
jgi:hypothetical protein